MNKILTILTLVILISSCRKDKPIVVDECAGVSYDNYSTDNFDYVKQALNGTSPFGSTYFFAKKYSFKNPVFNPNNPYQIALIRVNNESVGIDQEIWTFNFCTGNFIMVTDNVSYNLDWGSNGWLLFTDLNNKINKVKDNGDSLTVLSTESGYNRAGEWNPSGNLYWNSRDDGLSLKDSDGNTFKIISTNPFGAKGWINDSTLLGWRDDNFYSLTIGQETLTQLNTNWTSSTDPVIFDEDHLDCYVPSTINGRLLRYDLSGSNAVDTVSQLYASYFYGSGDYVNDVVIITLVRKHWKDSVADEIYQRMDLIITDGNFTNQRLVEVEY